VREAARWTREGAGGMRDLETETLAEDVSATMDGHFRDLTKWETENGVRPRYDYEIRFFVIRVIRLLTSVRCFNLGGRPCLCC